MTSSSQSSSPEPKHKLLDYYSLLDDIAIITRGMGWSYRDIKRLCVRERRYWSKWVTTMVENTKAAAK